MINASRLFRLSLMPAMIALASCTTPLAMNGDDTPEVTTVPSAGVTSQAPQRADLPDLPETRGPTVVGRQVENLRANLNTLKSDVAKSGERLQEIKENQQKAGEKYFASMAVIQAKLQGGTTPGNPRLIQLWQQTSHDLEELGQHIADMNAFSTEVAAQASLANFILDSVRATYSLSGAVEEDHANLGKLEDEVNRVVSQIDRAVTDLTRDVERQGNYLTSERRNLQSLAAAINSGELYGHSLANMTARRDSNMQPAAPSVPAPAPAANMLPEAKTDPNLLAMNAAPVAPVVAAPMVAPAPVATAVKTTTTTTTMTTKPLSGAPASGIVQPLKDPPGKEMPALSTNVAPIGQTLAQPETQAAMAPVPPAPAPALASDAAAGAAAKVVNATKPFIVIKFDQPDIDYGQPLYQAMQQALERNPYGAFEVVGVSMPGDNNPAQAAQAANAARKYSEGVVRTLAQMGIPSDRMQMSTATKDGLNAPEVHIFLRN